MNTFGFQCDKIIVIESLPDNEKDMREGKSYGEYYTKELFPHCNQLRTSPFAYELKKLSSASDLCLYLDTLSKDTIRLDIFPLLHFEIHGASERDGMVMKNGDFVHWLSLLDKLRDINKASLNNLFVVFATCSGAFNLNYIDINNGPFPYYAAIAPDNPDYPMLLENKYTKFYKDFLSNNDIQTAFNELIRKEGMSQIIPSTCEFMLYQGLMKAIDILNSPENLSNMVGEIYKHTDANFSDYSKIKEMTRAELNEQSYLKTTLQSFKTKLLMADHPRNKDRFLFTVEELIDSFQNAEDA